MTKEEQDTRRGKGEPLKYKQKRNIQRKKQGHRKYERNEGGTMQTF